MKSTLIIAFFALGSLVALGAAAAKGKLVCDEKDGMKPDGDLVKVIMGKCMPKGGEDAKKVAAGLVKCMMTKIHKAVDKKTGQMKKKEATGIISIFPENFHKKIATKFDECFDKHNAGIKKEQNGADSWLPFTECFYEFSQGLCPKKT